MLFLYCGLQYSKVEEKKNNKEEKNKEERLLDKDEHRKGGLLGRKFPRGVCYITETTSDSAALQSDKHGHWNNTALLSTCTYTAGCCFTAQKKFELKM